MYTKDNLFTVASRLEEQKSLVGYRVGWIEEGITYQRDFNKEDLEAAEKLMYEKGGWMTGIRLARPKV